MIPDDQVPNPNGLCFSHDYKKLYVASTGPAGKGDIHVLDVGDNKLSNQKVFTDCMVDGVKCGPDGVRCDVFGNLWASSNAGRTVGYSGVTVWSPAAKLLGRIRLPEVAATSASAAPSATGCSWPAASRSTPSTPRPKARRPADPPRNPRARQGARPGVPPACASALPDPADALR